ncbi:endolytic transglycosylase MltG [Lichenicoccus roseus]|uniref:endolytic transglycosylase MltG n=1 Tax=Lichenicoccus roseus TaxID=2683649 RepID=UPI001486E970|nr:endolytic transglycosylase MltG [Lichenicoccus roseus]
MRRTLGLIAAFLFAGVLLGAGMAAGALWWYWRPGPLPQATAIVIPHGGLAGAGAVLQREDALPDGPAALFGFRVAGRLTRSDGPVHAAEFEFPAHASVRELLLVLRTARPVQHQLTIPEGLTVAQIALLLASADALAGATPVVAEGSILPETYAYERGTTRAAIVTRMQAAMERRLQSAWTSRQPQPELPTPRDLLVLASLVERETARPAERPLVARVFLNRLHLGMRLQSDPTVIYGASGGLGTLARPLSRADLAQPNPYNSYLVTGLPPGPICSPGPAALDAAAHPAAGDMLYFVADGSGGHAFATDLPTHLQNVARLRALEGAHASKEPSR